MKYQLNVLSIFSCILFSLFATGSTAQTTDAGVSTIVSPAGSFCGGANNVIIVITNYGSNDITSLNIDWAVDNTPQTQLVYLDTLPAGSSDTINLGTFQFPSASNVSISATTSSPNGGLDDDTTNDGILSSGLTTRFSAGTYTIGGGSPDFSNLSSAVSALSTFGICGSVVFDIRSSIDTVRISIPSIAGASSSSTVTFQSEALNADSVKFTAPSDPNLGNPNYVLRLDGADHIILRHLTFERSGIEPYARVIEVRNSACFNTMENCVLQGSLQTQVANSLAAVIYSSFGAPTNDSNFTFSGNIVRNGSIGYYMNGLASLNPETNGAITDNQFINQYARAIAISNQGSMMIEGNTISSNTAYNQFTAIELDRSQRNQIVSKNRISGNVDMGINLIDCSGFNGTPGIISNNFIQSSDSVGIRMDNGENQLLAYNSVNVVGTSSGTASRFSGIGTGNFIKNNIFKHATGGKSVVILNSATAGIASMNHNDLYTNGSVLGSHDGIDIADLTGWQSANSSDTNSISSDPYFASASSLYPTAIALDGAGTPIFNVTDDIDGAPRNSSTPDIGAVEYVGTNHDIAAAAIISPNDGDCGNPSATITVVISNNGDASETGFNWAVSSALLANPIVSTYSDTLAAGSSDTLTLVGALNTSSGGTISIELSVDSYRDDNRSNDSISVSFSITAVPSAPIASADSVCLGSVSTLTANGNGTLNWYDSALNGNILASGQVFTTGPLSSSSNFYVSSTLNGCEGPRTAVAANILPQPNVSLGANLSIIQGDTATFDAGPGFTAYLWNTGATTQSIQVSDSGCYAVVVTNGFGCTATDDACLQLVLATDLYIGSLVSPVNGLCAGTSTPIVLQLNNNGPNVATNIPILINVSGATTATINGSVPGPLNPGDSVNVTLGTINTSSGGNIVIDVTLQYNAEADPSNDNFADTVFLPAEPALPSATDAARCGEGPVILSASASLPVLWYDTPTGGVLLSVGNSFTISNLNQTTTLYLQAGTFCVGQSRQAITATLYPIPVVDLGPDTSLILPYQLDAGAGFASYSWSNGETTQTIIANQYGSYSVVVYDQNGCFNSDTVSLTGTVGLSTLDELDQIRIFPNPNIGDFFINTPGSMKSDILYEVIDVQGAKISHGMIKRESGGQPQAISLGNVSKGVYAFKISTDEKLKTLRLVIQ